MAGWQPPVWFFGAVAGGIVGLILLIGIIGGIIKYTRDLRVEKDLEANRMMPESREPTAEMAEVTPARGPDEIRRAVNNDLAFVDVDLRDPSVRSLSVYSKFRKSLSRSRVMSKSRARAAAGGKA